MSKSEILRKLKTCQSIMLDTAVDLEFYGGFNEVITDHAKQLLGASTMLLTWIDGIEEIEHE